MKVRSRLHFSGDRTEALDALESVGSGRGWCNVVAEVADDVEDLKVNVFGLWINKGVAVVSFVTSPPREGAAQPSTLGALHTRGRLGRDRVAQLLSGAPFTLTQDHSQRGLLFSVPPDTPSAQVLDVMCTMATALCDYETTGGWRLDLYRRD